MNEMIKGKISVLLVDDESEILEMWNSTLYQQGVQTIIAKNGSEALFKLKNQSFDIVVTDIAMPKTNGLDLIKAIRQNPDSTSQTQIPIIVVSGNLEDYKSQLLLFKNVSSLEKPITGAQLFDQINATLINQNRPKQPKIKTNELYETINSQISDVSNSIFSTLFKNDTIIEQKEITVKDIAIETDTYFNARISLNKLRGFLIINLKNGLSFEICNRLKPDMFPDKEKIRRYWKVR